MEEENLEDNYEDINYLPKRHLILKWSGVCVAVLAVCTAAWYLSEIPNNAWNMTYPGARQASGREPRSPELLRDGSNQFDPSKVLGTSGTTPPTAVDADSGQAESTIRDLDAIIAKGGASSLVGRHVDLQVPVLGENNLVAFWVGSPDDEILVVLHRDRRDDQQRMTSQPPAHSIEPVHQGQQATISGTLQTVPDIEGRFSWELTRSQLDEVEGRGVYLLADNVRTTGQ
jgi:hypothetical protein